MKEAITVQGNPPSKSNTYKIVKHLNSYTLAKTKEVKKFESDFKLQVRPYVNKIKIKGQFSLTVAVYFRNKKQDLDNSLKVILDCLQDLGVIENDNLCRRIVAHKFVDEKNPKIIFKIDV